MPEATLRQEFVKSELPGGVVGGADGFGQAVLTGAAQSAFEKGGQANGLC